MSDDIKMKLKQIKKDKASSEWDVRANASLLDSMLDSAIDIKFRLEYADTPKGWIVGRLKQLDKEYQRTFDAYLDSWRKFRKLHFREQNYLKQLGGNGDE